MPFSGDPDGKGVVFSSMRAQAAGLALVRAVPAAPYFRAGASGFYPAAILSVPAKNLYGGTPSRQEVAAAGKATAAFPDEPKPVSSSE